MCGVAKYVCQLGVIHVIHCMKRGRLTKKLVKLDLRLEYRVGSIDWTRRPDDAFRYFSKFFLQNLYQPIP